MMIDRLGATLIRGSTLVDKGYRYYDRLRRELVLAFASDAVLDRYNDLTYGASEVYQPGTDGFRARLFDWEQRALDRYFPPPPASILVGGAGGGREAFALAAAGYRVTAFEPCRALAAAMLTHAPMGARLEVYQAGYQDLPTLWPVGLTGPERMLDSLGPFDAAILGWGSFPHLRTEQQRLDTLQVFARVVHGPVLVSLFTRPAGAAVRPGRLRRHLARQCQRKPGDAFGIMIGYYHQFTEDEFVSLADQSGFCVMDRTAIAHGETWPHAVLTPRPSLEPNPAGSYPVLSPTDAP